MNESKKELLEELKEKILKEQLPLRESAKNMVFGKGNEEAKIFFIGEAPGENEDLQGKPFVGQAGKELDKLLHSINLSLELVYIANILKYRPPNNRNPNKKEIESHTPFLIEQIKIIQPKVIITLGNYATKFVLNNFNAEGMNKVLGIAQLHGQFKEIQLDSMHFKVMPSFHPAAILYNPNLRKEIEKDFQKIKELI